MLNASININPNEIIGEVSDYLYGANLENLGQTIYGGSWAEMLRDRKFAGVDIMYTTASEGLTKQNPDYGVVIPWESVNPHYQNVLFVHDNTIYYTGKQSQRITVRHDDGNEHGIKQSNLYLEANFDYEVRIVLKGEGQTVTLQLGDATWQIPNAGEDWTTHTQTMTPSQTEQLGTFSITFEGEGSLWVGCASIMPADHRKGHRPDVIDALRDWTPTFLRWPGGNFVSAYRWQDGVGDMDKRPSYLDPAWRLYEPNDMGTDEFIDFCRMIGSEPVLTANMGDGTPEDAAAWVEYCNGEESTTYGAMRVANGYPEPHNVKVWFVGNEQYGNWQVGHTDAETWARNYLEFARAMRAVDPDLILIGLGVPTHLYGHWNELILKIAGSEMDWFSLHYYSVRTEKWENPPSQEELYIPKVAAAHELVQMLDDTQALIDQFSDPPIPIALDEWNTYVTAKTPDFIEEYNIADALYAGSLMNACINRCNNIKLTAIYNLINVMGNYMVTPLYKWSHLPDNRYGYWLGQVDEPVIPPMVWKQPNTLVMELLTQHRGGHAVRSSVESPTFSSPAMGSMDPMDNIPTIDASATYDTERKTVYLSIVNRSADEPATISLDGIQPSQDIQLYQVIGDSYLAYNSANNPTRVVIEEFTHPQSQSQTLEILPHSFTMAIIQI